MGVSTKATMPSVFYCIFMFLIGNEIAKKFNGFMTE